MQIVVWLIIGFVGGIFGGMGMGGGTFVIPLLVLFGGITQHAAQCINLISFIPMAVGALIFHIKNKLISFSKILWIIIPAVAVAAVASFFVKDMAPVILTKLFGGFLLALGVVLLISELKK